MLKNFHGLLLAGLIALGVSAGSLSSAQAGGYGYGHHDCYYKKVVTLVCKEVPYTKCITLYDHCGHPYTVHKTFYKTVHVPVVSYVKVCY